MVILTVKILIATLRPGTAGTHQAMVSIYWVGLLVPLWLLVISISGTPLVGFDPKHFWYYKGRKVLPQRPAVVPIGFCLSYRKNPRFRNLKLNCLSVLMMLEWNLLWITSLNPTRVPVRVSVYKRNLLPKRIMPGLIHVFRNGWGLSS